MYYSDLQYFPQINYIYTLYKSSSIEFVSSEMFIKSSFRNKMEVPSSAGVLKLSIPIKGGRAVRLPYGEVEIDYTSDWQENHFRTISSVFGSSPFFRFYSPQLDDLYSKKEERLFDWNLKCLDIFLRLSKMSNMIQYQVLHQKVGLDDFISNESVFSSDNRFENPPYEQVFSNKIGFKPNMSCLDLLMNLGPDSGRYIQDLTNKLH